MTPEQRRLLIELCGMMAYAELSAFERMSSDARFSPTLHDRATLGRLAVAEFAHFETVSDYLAQLGADVEVAMVPFQASVDAFHDRTRPADWYESLMKAYVIDAMSGDLFAVLGQSVDSALQDLIGRVQVPPELAGLLQGRLREVLAGDARLSSRLALWGRRLVGEALTQGQRLGRERSFLGALMSSAPEAEPLEPDKLRAHLTRAHSRRMNELGLTA